MRMLFFALLVVLSAIYEWARLIFPILSVCPRACLPIAHSRFHFRVCLCVLVFACALEIAAQAVHKMSKVIAAVPGMERFVRDVCAVVFSFDAPPHYAAALAGGSGGNSNSSNSKSNGANAQGAAAASLEHVVPTLRLWLDDLRHLASLRAFRASVETTLLDREVLQVI
jgi:hypothetical protein